MGKRRSLQGGVLQMEKVRHVLRLCELGFNQRAIARATGVARSSLQEYLRTAEVEGITYEHAALMTDAELREAFKKQRPGRSRIEVTEPNFLSCNGANQNHPTQPLITVDFWYHSCYFS
jgi:hypothetical protein